MKIAMFSTKEYDKRYFEKFNVDKNFDIEFFETRLDSHTVGLTKGFEAVCVFVNDKIDEKTLEAMHQNGIKLVALRCAGFNNVDLEAARKFDVKVVRVPAYSPEAVAEHAIALIMTLNRKTHKSYNRVREGNFSLNNLIGFNLSNKTVGVVGTGRIGVALCRILIGFGCKVIAYDLYPSDALIRMGIEYVDLDELFRQAEVISLHCPLTTETKHMINEKTLDVMKDGVMIINTSRGELIKTSDVIQGLIDRKVGYLGIDVYEQEEDLFFKDLSEHIIEDEFILRLNSFPNVLITSHQAYFTNDAMIEIASTTLDNIRDFKEGNALLNEVK